MIIEFSSSIQLSSWHQNGSYMHPIWLRQLIPYQDYDEIIMVNVQQDYLVGAPPMCYVNFYSQLAFLHKYFPNQDNRIVGNLEFAKNEVDNFLIKMSQLVAFL